MARRIEGTTAGGFRCDCQGCSLNAVWAVIVCTPFKEPGRPPILTFTDVHVCVDHWRTVKRDVATDHMLSAIKRVADERKGEPNFDGQWLARIGVHHPDFHRFQEMAGLIPEGDNLITIDAEPLKLF